MVALDVQSGDLVTVALLVALEGLLSADNALVMAIMVLGLPKPLHGPALRSSPGAVPGYRRSRGFGGMVRVAAHHCFAEPS